MMFLVVILELVIDHNPQLAFASSSLISSSIVIRTDFLK